MLNRSPCLSVTILPDRLPPISSTDLADIQARRRVEKAHRRERARTIWQEVCLSAVTCAPRRRGRPVSRPVDGFGERNESVEKPRSTFAKPNRKERLNSALRDLLIPPNTSGIALFEDQQRQQSAAAFELVMDRSAERAAGGCDAI